MALSLALSLSLSLSQAETAAKFTELEEAKAEIQNLLKELQDAKASAGRVSKRRGGESICESNMETRSGPWSSRHGLRAPFSHRPRFQVGPYVPTCLTLDTGRVLGWLRLGWLKIH